MDQLLQKRWMMKRMMMVVDPMVAQRVQMMNRMRMMELRWWLMMVMRMMVAYRRPLSFAVEAEKS